MIFPENRRVSSRNYLGLFTRDDVVSQRHKFGCAFLSSFSWESKIASFFNECVIFIGCNFESCASQVAYHKKKKDTASAKEGKVSYCVEEDKDARLCSIIKRRPVACSLRGRRLKGKEKGVV